MRSKVVHLGDYPIEDFLQNHDKVLLGVVLDVPILPGCERFYPEFEQLARTLLNTGSDVICAQVDPRDQPGMSVKYSIRPPFPNVVLFHGPRDFKKYHGIYKHEEMLAYLTRQTMPAVTAIADAAALKSIRSTSNVCVVAYLEPDNRNALQCFTTVAGEMCDDFVFGVTNNNALADAEDVAMPSIVVYKTVADKKTASTWPWTSPEGLRGFIKFATRPQVVELFPEINDIYVKDTLPIGYLFTSTAAQTELAAKALLPVARKYHGKIQLATVDIVDLFPALPDIMNLPKAGDGEQPWPAFALLDPRPNLKYPLGPIHLEGVSANPVADGPSRIDQHIAAFLDGTLKPVIKSKPIPKPDGSSAVTEVVGLTYDSIVKDETRDVFLQFCMVDCRLCAMIEPMYELVARLYAAHPDGPAVGDKVKIAKIDWEENDVPDRDVFGTPWFKLYPAAKKDAPVTYYGDFGWKNMANFIKENGTHGVGLDIPGYDD